MQVLINSIELPFQVDQDVYVYRTLRYWSQNVLKSVPYFSGRIKSIELGILPASRFVKKKGEPVRVLIDLITYEIQPHSHFNPFGPVQIQDHTKAGSSVFPSEEALLNATGQESSIYLQNGTLSSIPDSL